MPVCVHKTHRAADDFVIVGVPADVPHTRVMTRQPGHHHASQDVVDWTHTHTHTHMHTSDSSASWRGRAAFFVFFHAGSSTGTPRGTRTHWRFFPWSSRSRWTSARCWTPARSGSGWACAERRGRGRSSPTCRRSVCVSSGLQIQKTDLKNSSLT